MVQGEADFIYAKFPSDFFCSNLSKQELRPNKRENKICGCSLNMDMDMKSFRGKENRQNVNVHMDIYEGEKKGKERKAI